MGVFAIRNIPKGSYVFEGDVTKTVTIGTKFLNELPLAVREMYTDFCVFIKEKDEMICPEDLNAMPASWYLNHSDSRQNIGCDKDYQFYTLIDIKDGDELLVDYGTYSDLPPGITDFTQ